MRISVLWLVFISFHAVGVANAQDKGGDHGGGMRPEVKAPRGLTEAQKQRLLEQGLPGVPHHEQVGPACGMYAMAMVMGYHHGLDNRNPYPRVRDADKFGQPGVPTMMSKVTNPIIEHFDGRTLHVQLAELAKHFGYRSEAGMTLKAATPFSPFVPKEIRGARIPTMDMLQESIIARQPVIVAIRDFDEATGMPLPDGPPFNSHWVVLTGFAYDPDSGERFVIVQHGLSTGPVIWRLADFEASWNGAFRSTVFVAPPLR